MPVRILSLALVCLVAFLWLPWGESEPGDPRVETERMVMRDSSAPEAAEVEPQREAVQREHEPPSEVQDPAPTEEGRRVLLRIVDDFGASVPEAEVARCWTLRGQRPVVDHEAAAWAGERVLSDEHGLAWIPLEANANEVIVYARKSNTWGQAALREFDGVLEVTVVLKVDLTLVVQVQDDLGRPIEGVNVLVSKKEDEGSQSGFLSGTSEGPEGMIRFEHMQERFPENFDGAAVVQFAAPSSLPEVVHVDLKPPPLEPVVLRLPELGGLRMRMVDAEGQPVGELSEQLTIGNFLETSVVRLQYRDQGGELRDFPLTFTGDQIELFPIGVGIEFRLEIESVLMRGKSDWFAGPARSGEWVDHEVEVEILPVLSGRLVNAAGVPLVGYWHATGMRPGEASYNQYFETEEDGAFLIPFPTIDEAVREQLSVVFRPSARDRVAPSAFIDGSTFTWFSGVNELGDVVMGELPILAQGSTQKRDGTPVPGVTVVVLHGESGGDLYSTRWVQSVTSDAAGKFTLRGFFPQAQEFVIATSGGGHQRARAGARHLVCWIQD